MPEVLSSEQRRLPVVLSRRIMGGASGGESSFVRLSLSLSLCVPPSLNSPAPVRRGLWWCNELNGSTVREGCGGGGMKRGASHGGGRSRVAPVRDSFGSSDG